MDHHHLVEEDGIDLPMAWKSSKVREVLSCGNTKLWELVKSGALSGPLKLDVGPRWDSREVMRYLHAQFEKAKAERKQKGAA